MPGADGTESDRNARSQRSSWTMEAILTATSTSGRKVFTDCPTEKDDKTADD